MMGGAARLAGLDPAPAGPAPSAPRSGSQYAAVPQLPGDAAGGGGGSGDTSSKL